MTAGELQKYIETSVRNRRGKQNRERYGGNDTHQEEDPDAAKKDAERQKKLRRRGVLKG